MEELLMARSTRSRTGSGARNSGRKGRRSATGGPIEFFTRPEQHIVWRVLGIAVRARAELALVAVLVTAWLWTRALLAPPPPPEQLPEQSVMTDPAAPAPGVDADLVFVIGVAALILMVVAVPASRRFVVRRVWCVITRHRIRACFTQTHTMTHHGRMPLLVWSRPSPVGERVRVWLPAGLCVKDLENNKDELAAACWAREVRITPVRSQAALVVVDIVRRNPLGGAALTPSVIDDLDQADIARHTAGYGDPDSDGVVIPLPDRSAAAPPPDPTTGAAPGTTGPAGNGSARSNGRKPADQQGPPAESSVTGFGGMDVSDYI
jgi:hypothetical protein